MAPDPHFRRVKRDSLSAVADPGGQGAMPPPPPPHKLMIVCRKAVRVAVVVT